MCGGLWSGSGGSAFLHRGWAAWSDLSFRSVRLETLWRMDLAVRRAEVRVPVRRPVLRPRRVWSRRHGLGKHLGEFSGLLGCKQQMPTLYNNQSKDNVLSLLMGTYRTEVTSEEPSLEQTGVRQLRGSWWQELSIVSLS